MAKNSKLTKEELAVEVRRAKERVELSQSVLDFMLIKRLDVLSATNRAEIELCVAQRDLAKLEGRYREY